MLAQPAAEELVGRTAELAAVASALDELERGRCAVLTVLGEPGIGKTSLLRALGALADRRGLLVLAGSASELERDLPFGVFTDALDDYVQTLEPHRLDALEADVRTELGEVLPSLAAAPGAATDHRFRTHRAVRRLLEVLATPKPLVLILDDLHWADSGSVELLGAMLRRPPAASVLLALAARPRQATARLWAAFERAAATVAHTRLELGALSAVDARSLLAGRLAPAGADALYAQAGGNPFYLRQLARAPAPGAAAMSDGDDPVGEAGVWWPAEAAGELDALALLPSYVGRRAIVARVGPVEIP